MDVDPEWGNAGRSLRRRLASRKERASTERREPAEKGSTRQSIIV